MSLKSNSAALALAAAAVVSAAAHEIAAPPNQAVPAAFDIVGARVRRDGPDVVFRMQVRGGAGGVLPDSVGAMAGSRAHAYVWPTTLDTSAVGFEPAQGLLALAVTFHPDFDDAAAGARNRDVWHPHWVVLVPEPRCGASTLDVRDIPPGERPRLPQTWPGVPLLIDSPHLPTWLEGDAVSVRVPAARIGAEATFGFDGVTAALSIGANLHAPLFCVTGVFDVASGNLSLPGRAE